MGAFSWGAMVASLQDRYSCCNTVMDAVARPGAFAANFTPEVLDQFRDLCKQQGKQYTKVLQLLAALSGREALVIGRRFGIELEAPNPQREAIRAHENEALKSMKKGV